MSAENDVPTTEQATDEQLFQVLDEPLVLEKVIQLVEGAFGGAVATFTGIVREQTKGRKVVSLDYEAYPSMALKELKKIAMEVRDKWPKVQVAIHHRIGHLKVGDKAVVIAVCSPHRQAAFAACSHTIERLKETVPIWKKEHFEDGTTWVGWGP